MSLLKIDTKALTKEVEQIHKMFPGEEGHKLASRLGFEAEKRDENYIYRKGTAVVYFAGNFKNDYEVWITAQKGKISLVAHITHFNLDHALIDAINRDC
jgi:hypothetical protein